MSVGTDQQHISDTGAVESFCDTGPDEVSDRLLRSAACSSRNAMVEIDWNAPLDPTKYGCSPEWSTLFGTAYWNEMTEEQRISLTRHEFASIMSIGIWFEMMLQELVFRDQYLADYHRPEFQFAMTEVADECRHSLMFALATKKMVGTCYQPHPRLGRFAKLFKSTARNEVAYAGILVAEEILDVFQRGCMRDERVLPFIRTVNEIHVLEESRHMRFAREEVRQRMQGVGWLRRQWSALNVALASSYIVLSLVRPRAYADAGLDYHRAVAEMRANHHFQSMVRSGCAHLMQFLDEVGLLTPAAARIYRKVHML
ncbi:diiron oxygenase [Gordonia sp. ABSL11-1]|uniref:AurF N-oxygenase family protein n=1 Tax=Gordonia sp. ABSL11-1 TaxID=3053924 RepID=UPI0025730319|nr:diiron oxygenase [Gordonia sp. ABSL11-1]MDL9947225.1 diiron oxygenase [Gordonia sp. ABSL11-1]